MKGGDFWCGVKKTEEEIEETHKGSAKVRGMMVRPRREMVFDSRWIRHERNWRTQEKEETRADDEGE